MSKYLFKIKDLFFLIAFCMVFMFAGSVSADADFNVCPDETGWHICADLNHTSMDGDLISATEAQSLNIQSTLFPTLNGNDTGDEIAMATYPSVKKPDTCMANCQRIRIEEVGWQA